MSVAAPGFVEFDHVWKKFRYGEHNQLREAIPALTRRLFGRRDQEAELWTGEFWALRDVEFTVGPGEAFGIIGPNGAGKSTILKLLTRILRPTLGQCAIRGRVGALIEVTAGFHPDLTGRENVYLQGAIMGMPRRDIARRFDEIVAFSGVSDFIDTPVKRYSSGMQARLGFSIAAHLEPDVLVVDEALSVGDESFQRKAFSRVRELVKRQIPIVVVSHQLDAVQSLCTHAMLLDRGTVVCTGTPGECIRTYLGGLATAATSSDDVPVRIESLTLSSPSVASGDTLAASLAGRVRDGGKAGRASIRVRIRSATGGETLYEADSAQLGAAVPHSGDFALAFELQMNVPRGVYIVESAVWDGLRGRTFGEGPTSYVEVAGGAPFEGSVQMNATLRASPSADNVG